MRFRLSRPPCEPVPKATTRNGTGSWVHTRTLRSWRLTSRISRVLGHVLPCLGLSWALSPPGGPGGPGGPGDRPAVLLRGPAGGEAVPQVQGDGEEVRVRGLCLLQLQRPPVVSVPEPCVGPGLPARLCPLRSLCRCSVGLPSGQLGREQGEASREPPARQGPGREGDRQQVGGAVPPTGPVVASGVGLCPEQGVTYRFTHKSSRWPPREPVDRRQQKRDQDFREGAVLRRTGTVAQTWPLRAQRADGQG